MALFEAPFAGQGKQDGKVKKNGPVLQIRSGGDGGGGMARGFGFDAAPAYGATVDGFFHGAEQDDVHELAVIEALEKDGNEEGPILVAFESEGDHAGKDVDDQESQKENHGTLDVGGGPKVGNLADVQLRQAPKQQATEEEQVNDGGNQRESDLEDENVGQGDPTECAMLQPEQSTAVLPEGLQGAKGPTETLSNEGLWSDGGFGPGDGIFVIGDAPAEAANGDGEIGVFGDGVRRDATGGFDGLATPGTKSAGNDRDAIQEIEGALFHVLAGDVFERLPAREPAGAIANLNVAGGGADLRIGKVAEQIGDGVGLDFGVRVNGDDEFRLRMGERIVQR